ncbi:MAG: hypothetical protein AAB821_02770 [Patescibacteria group bacterium]
MSLVTTLSEKLKIAPLPPDEQRAIMADLESIITANITSAILETLDDKGREQFEQMVAVASDQEIVTFVNQHLSNFEELKEREAMAVITDFLSNFD